MLLLLGSQAIRAEQPKSLLNLNDADIRALIGTVSKATGRNFVVDPRVKGKVTVISSTPTESADIYELFLSILQVNGFSAIETNDVVKIVPLTGATQQGTPATGEQDESPDSLVTRLFTLNHTSAAELVPILRPLLPQHAHLAAHTASNALIAADSSANIGRLATLVARIDQPLDRAIEIVRLENASASDLVPILQGMVATKIPLPGATLAPPTLSADPRTNTILIAGTREFRLEMRSLIGHLDTPLGFSADTRVIYLHYSEADDLVPILQSLSGGDSKKKAAGRDIEIQADPRVNALILQGDPQRILAMQHIISQLDVRRAQVMVEGIIAEVAEDDSEELGIQWRTAATDHGEFAGIEFPGVNSGSIDLFDATDIGAGFTLGFIRNQSIRGLLRAISSTRGTNLLSTPSLVTLDNEEAEIVVGENVPFITGQFTNDTSSPENPFQTIERQDVGVVLRVRPQINEGDAIRLEIEQEVSSVEVNREGSDLITSKRSIRTTVMADDGQIVALGGLISEDHQDAINKVPLLGDIPLVGKLFQNRTETYLKSNLLVFLRPTIIRDNLRGAALTADKYSYIRGLQLGHHQRQGNGDRAVLLPPVDVSRQQGSTSTPAPHRKLPAKSPGEADDVGDPDDFWDDDE